MGWWELLSGFEDDFADEGWNVDGTPFEIVTEEYHSGTHSAKSLTDSVGSLYHTLGCVPTEYYALRLWFKITGTVPTGGGSSIIWRLFLSDDSDVQVYLATQAGSPNPYLYCIYLENFDLGTTEITLNEWHLLHIKQYVLNGTAQTLVYLDDLETPELTMVNDLTGLNLIMVELQPVIWIEPYTGRVYYDSVIGSCDFWDEDDLPDGDEILPPIPTINPYVLYINGIPRDYIKVHYVKNHPDPDPDTFNIIVNRDVGELVNYFDSVEVKKNGVTEFYGFVEDINQQKGEEGLEYIIAGRCWKVLLWKKFTERFQESREIGPEDSEGNIETGFFGSVYPQELFRFLLRCPISEHPKGKVRHKIGWGIASDFWTCCANVTADTFYPDWVGLRYTGLSWRGRASTENLHYINLICNSFDSTYLDWTENGSSPYLDEDSDADNITAGTPPNNQKEGYFGFDNLGGTAQTIYAIKLYVRANVQGYGQEVAVYLNDGTSDYKMGYLNFCPWGYGYTEFNCITILDTPTKVNNAKIYFDLESGYHAIVTVIYTYLHVEYSTSGDADINQKADDWFVVNLGTDHDRVTAILMECRNNPNMYARNYKIQHCIISDCCAEGGHDSQWSDFDPPVNVTSNTARDILHSWKPQDNVHGVRIKLTANAPSPWEISQIYVWEAEKEKYKILSDAET